MAECSNSNEESGAERENREINTLNTEEGLDSAEVSDSADDSYDGRARFLTYECEFARMTIQLPSYMTLRENRLRKVRRVEVDTMRAKAKTSRARRSLHLVIEPPAESSSESDDNEVERSIDRDQPAKSTSESRRRELPDHAREASQVAIAKRKRSGLALSACSIVRYLRAGFHQSTEGRFAKYSRGRQCCAVSVVALVKASYSNPADWKSSTLNRILREGDRLYKMLIKKMEAKGEKDKDGYLKVADLSYMNYKFPLFENNYQILHREELGLIGSTCDKISGRMNVQTVDEAIYRVLDVGSGKGVFVAKFMCFGIFKHDGLYYLNDSHGVNRFGNPILDEGENALACLTICLNRRTLVDKLKEKIGWQAVDFNLDEVSVVRS